MKQMLHLTHPRTWAALSMVVVLALLPLGANPLPAAAQESAANPDNSTATLTWNTFLGGGDSDSAAAMVTDGAGNLYVTGTSRATWGAPVRAFQGDFDAFVAKLNSSGALQWLTFLGGTNTDSGSGLTVDSSGNVYVVGSSYLPWGSPVRPHAGPGKADAFVAKLNSSGALQWHTFLGGAEYDSGMTIARNAGGEIYVAGISAATWSTPLRSFAGDEDTFVAKLNSSGVLQLLTFVGGAGKDWAKGMVVGTNAVYVVGESSATWGDPERPYTGGADAFVAHLNGSLTFLWNTFYGSAATDRATAVALDGSSGVFVAGASSAAWGNFAPINRYNGGDDVFVGKVNTTGALSWHTFLGSDGGDTGEAIARDGSGNVLVAGKSFLTWGPTAKGANETLFAAKLNSSGVLQTNAFLGASNADGVAAIALDGSNNVLLAGYSNTSWGAPVRPFSAQLDGFVAEIPAFGTRVGQNFGPVAAVPSAVNIGQTAQVNANPSSSLPVRVTVSGPCSVATKTVTGQAPGGTCTIIVHQDGNHIYASAPDSAATLYVRLEQTITFPQPPDRTLGDAPFALSAAASSGLAVSSASNTPAVCTVSGSTVTLLAAGSCTIVASQAGNGTYSPAANVNRSFTVQKRAQSITFGALPDRTVGDAPFSLSATASSGLAVSFASTTPAVCTVSGSTATLLAAGSCTIVASQAGNNTYSPAANVNRSFTVQKRAQSITFGALPDRTMGDAPFSLSATASSGLAVSFASTTPAVCTVSGSTATLLAGGSCTIVASQAGNGTYSPAANVNRSFTVQKRAQSITFGALPDRTVGDAPFSLSATASSGLAVSFSSTTQSICTVSGSTATLLAGGSCTIVASQAGNGTFSAAPNVNRSFTVQKQAQTITFGQLPDRTLGDAPFTLNATASSSLAVSVSSSTPAICTVSGNKVTLAAVGVCTVVAAQAGNAQYAAAAPVSRSFTVRPLAVNVTVELYLPLVKK